VLPVGDVEGLAAPSLSDLLVDTMPVTLVASGFLGGSRETFLGASSSSSSSFSSSSGTSEKEKAIKKINYFSSIRATNDGRCSRGDLGRLAQNEAL